MKYCENCGKEIPENSDFCPECGYRQNTLLSTRANGSFFDMGALIVAVLAIVQIILWNISKVNINAFFINLSFSFNDLFVSAPALLKQFGYDGLGYLSYINYLFYAVTIALAVIAILTKKKAKIPMMICQIIILAILLGMQIVIAVKLGDMSSFVKMDWGYWAFIAVSLAEMFFILKKQKQFQQI